MGALVEPIQTTLDKMSWLSICRFIGVTLLAIGCATGAATAQEFLVDDRGNELSGVELSGIVADAQTGEKIANAVVLVVHNDSIVATTHTDADGHYNLHLHKRVQALQTISLSFHLLGYPPAEQEHVSTTESARYDAHLGRKAECVCPENGMRCCQVRPLVVSAVTKVAVNEMPTLRSPH